HIIATMAEQGRAVVLVSPNILFAKGAAARMRSRWIQEDLLESVIALPAGLWQPTTNVPPVILVFNKQKSKDKRSFVTFVQVDGEPLIQTLPRSRGRKVIREEAILQLAEMLAADLAWQCPRDDCRVSIQGFVVEDELEDFARADFDLSPSRYIEAYEHAAHWWKVEARFLEEAQAAASFRAAEVRLDQILKQRWADMDKGE
ncbi:MAG: N-6 DNA methylase, partial [Verrucomicrobiota bacterium]